MAAPMQASLRQLSNEAVELYLGSQIASINLDSSSLTSMKFYREYVSSNRPLVIRNAINHWSALGSWTDEYLSELVGDDAVTVTITPNGYADAITDGVFMLPAEQEMTFSRFLTKLKSKDDSAVYYIQKQNSNMTSEFHKLMKDVDSDISWATVAFDCEPDAVNFWMGDERAVTSMHKDHYENLYCVVRGSKYFTLIPPTDQAYVPYKQVQVFRYKQLQDGVFTKVKDKDYTQLPWIPVDPTAPDLASYPEFAQAHIYTVQVNAGEMLYLPSLWYHHVRQSQGCIAVNYWYDMQYDIKYNYYQFVSGLVNQTL